MIDIPKLRELLAKATPANAAVCLIVALPLLTWDTFYDTDHFAEFDSPLSRWYKFCRALSGVKP